MLLQLSFDTGHPFAKMVAFVAYVNPQETILVILLAAGAHSQSEIECIPAGNDCDYLSV